MPIASACPKCGKKLTLSDSVLGRMIRCPGCKEPFRASPASEPAPPLVLDAPALAAASPDLDLLEVRPVPDAAPPDLPKVPPPTVPPAGSDIDDDIPVVLLDPAVPSKDEGDIPVALVDSEDEELPRPRRDPDRARGDRERDRERDWERDRGRERERDRNRDPRDRDPDRDLDRDRRSGRGGSRPRASGSGWILGLILGLVGVALLGCCGVVGLVIYVGKTAQDQLANPPIPAANWTAFRPDVGGCIVSMPGTPFSIPVRGLPPEARAAREYELSLNQYNRNFVIATMEFPQAAMNLTEDEKLRNLITARYGAQTTGTPPDPASVERRNVVYQGRMGKEIHYHMGPVAVIERSLMVRRADGVTVAYFLQVRGLGLRPDSPEVEKFFGSLQIDPAGINAKPDPKPLDPKPGPGVNPVTPPGPERLTLLANSRLMIHPTGTQLVRVAPDGKSFAALGEDGIVKLVDVPDLGNRQFWPVRATLPKFPASPRDLVCDPTSTLLAVVAGDSVHLFDARNGQVVQVLTGPPVVGVAFAPTGDRVAMSVRTPDGASAIHFRVCRGGRNHGNPIPLPAGVGDLVWSADGSLLAVAVQNSVHLVEAHQGKPLGDPIVAHTAPITGLAFTPDGKGLITVGGKAVKRWSLADRRIVDAYEGTLNPKATMAFEPTGRPVFNPDGSRLAVGGGSGDSELVRMWRTATARPLLTRDLAGPGEVGSLDYLRDGQTLLVAVRNEPLRVQDLRGIEAANAGITSFKSTMAGEAARFTVSGGIEFVRFSPDGKTLLVGGRDGTTFLLDTGDWSLLSAKGTAAKQRRPATFAGTRLVALRGAGAQTLLDVHNPISGSLLLSVPGASGWPRCIAASPDGKFVAVGFDSAAPPRVGEPAPPGASGIVRLWNLSGATPEPIVTLGGLPYPLSTLTFAPDGATLYAGAGNEVKRWRSATREELPAWKGPASPLSALAVAPDGRVFAGARDDVLIHVWDAAGKHLTPWEGHTGGVTGLALTSDGKRLASAARDGTCRLWDARTGEAREVIPGKSTGEAPGLPAFSPDGSLLAVAADDNTVSILNTAKLPAQPAAPAPPPGPPPPGPAAFRPTTEPGGVSALAPPPRGFFHAALFSDKGTLLTADSGNVLRRWDWPAGNPRDEQKLDSVSRLAISRNGKVLAVYRQASILLRDADSGKVIATVHPEQLDRNMGYIHSFALSPDGGLLALNIMAPKVREVVIWDVQAGRQVASLNPESWAQAVDFSPDGATLAVTVYINQCVVLFDTKEWKETRRVVKQKTIQFVAFSPDGKRLAVSSQEGQVAVWDIAEDKELWSGKWTLPNAAYQPLRFSPDGKWLGTADRDRMVLLDAATGKLRVEVMQKPYAFADPAFSPDGKYLAVVGGTHRPIFVYDMEKLLAKP